jgi:hypothetical protein
LNNIQENYFMKILIKLCIGMLVLVIVFGYGAMVGKFQLFPYEYLWTLAKTATSGGFGRYDDYGRLVDFTSKTTIECPAQNDRTGVLLFIGQSNSANHGANMVKTIYPQKVANYFEGKCYVAQSPLLGASGQNGEYATLIADKLIQNGTYDNVIIVSSGIGGSWITLWAEDGHFNNMLLSVIDGFSADLNITDVIWHQGESDADFFTHTKIYVDMFLSLMKTLSDRGVNAPYYMSIASLCKNPDVTYPNKVTKAQAKLIEDHDNIFLGVNTDELVTGEYRFDGCHFNEKGQEVTAVAISNAIFNLRKEKPDFNK